LTDICYKPIGKIFMPLKECIFSITPEMAAQCCGMLTKHHVLQKSEGGAGGKTVMVCEVHHRFINDHSAVIGGEDFSHLQVVYKFQDRAKLPTPNIIQEDALTWVRAKRDFATEYGDPATRDVQAAHWNEMLRTKDWRGITAELLEEAGSVREDKEIYKDKEKERIARSFENFARALSTTAELTARRQPIIENRKGKTAPAPASLPRRLRLLGGRIY
jgi:hypothetical protein